MGGEYLIENLWIANGLLARLGTQLRIAATLKMVEEDEVALLYKKIDSVMAMIERVEGVD